MDFLGLVGLAVDALARQVANCKLQGKRAKCKLSDLVSIAADEDLPWTSRCTLI